MRLEPRLCPTPLWESLAREDASATFFQTPLWLHLAALHLASAGGRPRTEPFPLLFDFPQGPACLPLLRDQRWGRDVFFTPFGTYASLLSGRALDADEIRRVEAELGRLNLLMPVSPFARNPVRTGAVRPARTQVIDLTPDHIGTPERFWDPDPRRRLRIAGENGVRVRAATSREDWDAYYGLYLKSLERWGADTTSSYPASLFEAIRVASETAQSPAIRLWLAEHEGKPAGGYLAFYHNHHACIWHGAADREYFKLGATQQLYHAMISDAAQRGYAVFDLMGSAGLSALEAFKASVGARTVEYDTSLNRVGLAGGLAGLWARARGRA